METITKKMIERQLLNLVSISHLAATHKEAVESGKDHYITYEYAAVYGGYRLIAVNIHNGGHSGAFGMSSCEPRKTAKEFYSMLQGMIAGVEYAEKMLIQA